MKDYLSLKMRVSKGGETLKFIYYIIHTFIKYPDEDLEWFKDKKATCKKCGRTYFNWEV
jgi:hypothetical protein